MSPASDQRGQNYAERVFLYALQALPSSEVAGALARRGVFVSHGDFYASTVVARLKLGPEGLVRAGCACYTSEQEVERLLEGVEDLSR